LIVPHFPVLMYHALWPPLDAAALQQWISQDPHLRDPGVHLYALDQRVFRSQLRSIAQRGLQTPRQWAEFDTPSIEHPIWLTFDDGHQSNFSLAFPALAETGLTAVFFITTDRIGRPGFMSPEELRELRRAGMFIGSHGCSHRYLSDLPDGEILEEMTRSKASLETILGEDVPALSLPGGRGDGRLRSLATRAGYRHVFTSVMALADPAGDSLAWPRVALTNRQPADFLERLLDGDDSVLRRMARRAAGRRLVQRLLGNTLYDRLRGWLIAHRA
jgi:peptidoglycan/xylan/chitin deacetylase (PgdA/CDA1 family)